MGTAAIARSNPLIFSLLTPWADRGVLLLNACLTVRAHNANSHSNHGWEQFTSEVLRAVAKSSRGIVFLAWGTPAQKRVDSIGVDKSKHCILRSVHPSPLSAARGFFDCKHFIKANEWLKDRYGVEGEVEWDCLADGKQGKGLQQNKNEDNGPAARASATVAEAKD
jgi:uracil-DNA glycosylase